MPRSSSLAPILLLAACGGGPGDTTATGSTGPTTGPTTGPSSGGPTGEPTSAPTTSGGPTGGPGGTTLVPSMYMYQNAFLYNRVGYAAAVATILAVVIFVLAGIVLRIGDRSEAA